MCTPKPNASSAPSPVPAPDQHRDLAERLIILALAPKPGHAGGIPY
ncbi:MAG TPA: hypothetical protein VF070_03310 [Streptosporangiaceae bacterium]